MRDVTKLLSERRLNRDDAVYILGEVAKCIQGRHNVARATRYKFTATKVRDPKDLAAGSRRFDNDIYKSWETGSLKLPEIDWKNDRLPVQCEQGTTGAKRLTSRTEAMARAWRVRKADPENYMYLTERLPSFVKLVTTIECLIKAERRLHGGLETMSSREYAELETLNFVIRECNRVLNPSQSDPRPQIRCAAGDRQVINRRIKELRRKRLASLHHNNSHF